MICMSSKNNIRFLYTMCFVLVLMFSYGLNVKKTTNHHHIVASTEDSNYRKLNTYLLKLSDTLYLSNFDVIVFLSENGCPSCNRDFSKAILNYLINKDNVLIILNAKGYQIDIRPYLSKESINVVSDYSSNFYRLKLFYGSGVILLKDQQIEEIIELKLDNMEQTIRLLKHIGEYN